MVASKKYSRSVVKSKVTNNLASQKVKDNLLFELSTNQTYRDVALSEKTWGPKMPCIDSYRKPSLLTKIKHSLMHRRSLQMDKTCSEVPDIDAELGKTDEKYSKAWKLKLFSHKTIEETRRKLKMVNNRNSLSDSTLIQGTEDFLYLNHQEILASSYATKTCSMTGYTRRKSTSSADSDPFLTSLRFSRRKSMKEPSLHQQAR